MTAFEVVDNRRTQGQDTQTQLLTTISSNILNAGVVLGQPVSDWRGIHLAGCRGYMEINGELVGEGMGADVMGHPLEPLAWLANALADQGRELKAGMVVITGSIVSPKWLSAWRLCPHRNRGAGQGRVERQVGRTLSNRAAGLAGAALFSRRGCI